MRLPLAAGGRCTAELRVQAIPKCYDRFEKGFDVPEPFALQYEVEEET
jgi:hypothetical protein